MWRRCAHPDEGGVKLLPALAAALGPYFDFLGVAYINRDGVEKDLMAARVWLSKATAEEYPGAQELLDNPRVFPVAQAPGEGVVLQEVSAAPPSVPCV